jgi:TetR/AcrR family transcriptional regulator
LESKRERILDAAFDKFKRYGFLKTTIDEIAQLAQVGKGTIYFYFKNKEDILESLVDRELSRGFRLVADAMAKQQTVGGQLRTLIEMSFDYFHRNELVSKVLAMDQGFVLSAITKKNKEIQHVSIQGIQHLLEQGMKEGVFREFDAHKAAYIIDSLIRSFHYLHYLDLEEYPPDEIIDTVIALVFKGIETE